MTESTPVDVESGDVKRIRRLYGSEAILTIAVGVSPKSSGSGPLYIVPI